MSSKIFLRATSLPCAAAAILLIAGCAAPSSSSTPTPQVAATEPAPTNTLKTLDYSGSQQSLESLDRAITAAGADGSKASAIVHDLVELLRQPDATFTAQQAAAQRLGQLLTRPADIASAIATLEPLLTDERLSNLARLALEPVPGAAVDAAFLRALAAPETGARVGLVQSIGNRRIANAVPQLAPFLKDRDEHTAAAATKALGQIGNADALAALDNAPDPAGRAVVEARLACAWNLPATEGVTVFRRIYDDTKVSAPQRAIAFRGLLGCGPAAAGQRIVDALRGDDVAAKRVAIEALSAPSIKGVTPLLLDKFDAFDAPTKAAVLAALSRQKDAAAGPAAVKAVADSDASVRAAGLAALGVLPGTADVANQLAKFLSEATGDDAKAARQSLARLNGPGVNDAILAGATQGEPRLRAVFIELLGLRGMNEALPPLWKMREDASGAVRAAAVRAVGDLAAGSDQAAMLAWTIGATDSQEITRAQRALVSISQRNHDVAARDRVITDAIDHGSPAAQLRLLPVLNRLGGPAALACAGRLALEPTANVASAATDTLARWPDRAALPLLVAAAEKSTLSEVRETAVKGAVEFLDRTRGVPADEPFDVVGRLLGVAKQTDTRKSLIFLLSRGSAPAALALAEKLSAEADVADEAREAALAIRANQVWPPVVTASPSPGQARNLVDGNFRTTWSVPAIAGQWVQVDCKQSRPVRRVTLDQTSRPGDYPGTVEVFVTDDPAQPGAARASASGRREKTVIDLPAGIHGRYVIVKSSAKRGGGGGNWSIAELRID